MDQDQPVPSPLNREELAMMTSKINDALAGYSDKDWNYSRLALQMKELSLIDGPYALWIEVVPTETTQGKRDLKTCSIEVSWGERHSNELGILEIVSLRMNRALCEMTTDDFWNQQRPVIRVVARQKLIHQRVTEALWYEVHEVSGEEFDTR